MSHNKAKPRHCKDPGGLEKALGSIVPEFHLICIKGNFPFKNFVEVTYRRLPFLEQILLDF